MPPVTQQFVCFIKENSQFELMLDEGLRMIFDLNNKTRWIVLITTDIKSSIDDVVKKSLSKTMGYMMGRGLKITNSFIAFPHRNKNFENIMNEFMLTIMNVKCIG